MTKRVVATAALAATFISVCKAQTIDPLSVTSLRLTINHDDTPIAYATGFVMAKNNKYYLVTNRHVVLDCAQDESSNDVGGWICANRISILQNVENPRGQWIWKTERLYDDQGKRRWFEHPTLRGGVDVVALPLTQTDDVRFYPLNLKLLKTSIAVAPGDAVSIVGFPFGETQTTQSPQAAIGLAIWKTGTVASDIGVDLNGRPTFLVDTTSRAGMSGSPVYAVRFGAFRDTQGELVVSNSGAALKFLGVYSAQNVNAEIGLVWKADVVQALYDSLP